MISSDAGHVPHTFRSESAPGPLKIPQLLNQNDPPLCQVVPSWVREGDRPSAILHGALSIVVWSSLVDGKKQSGSLPMNSGTSAAYDVCLQSAWSRDSSGGLGGSFWWGQLPCDWDQMSVTTAQGDTLAGTFSSYGEETLLTNFVFVPELPLSPGE